MKEHLRSPAALPYDYVPAWLVSYVCWIVMIQFCTPCFCEELPTALVKAQNVRVTAIEKASQTAVGIFGPGSRGGGSGVVIAADGYALTNYHVVQSCDAFMKCSMADGELYDAVIVGIDPVGDVALIKLLGRNDFPVATMADSDSVKQGEYCFAVGNPFLLATNFQPSVSWGIISGTHRYQYPAGTILEYTDCIQTDAAINPGNSGGPLFNAKGELIGINGRGSFEKRGRVNVGVGYAISINQIKNFMDHLRSGRIVDHATLGATVATDSQRTVRVSNILDSSQAFRRGLAYDDEITRFANREIQTVNQFKNVLGIFPKGWRVPIEFRRDGVEKEIFVRLTGVHATEELAELIDSEAEVPAEPGNNPDSENPNSNGESKTSKPENPYEHLFVARPGFANYHFNLENQKRIWSGFQRHGDFTRYRSRWRLTGDDDRGRKTTIVLGDSESGIQIGGDSFVLDPNVDLSSQLVPQGSGGLLVALHLWRKMLILGPKVFGDVYYLGSVPNRYSAGNGEILVATRGVAESNFVFDKLNQRLLALEMYADPDTDPCELYFADYKINGPLLTPSTIKYAFGNQPPSSIKIDKIEFLENETTIESE